MANLQYIGARYVPKFYENPDTGDMTWKSGVGYEALTVVTYNSDTYTSKKPVPSSVGDPANNGAYWAKTADYNAAIAGLQDEINDLDNRIDAIGQHKNIVCVGDSYGSLLSKNWPEFIEDYMLPDDLQNMCASGGGIVGNAGATGYYITQLQGATDKNLVDTIIIAGGFNDAYPNSGGVYVPYSTILSGFSDIKNYVAASFPNAKIYVAFLGYCSDLHGSNTTTGQINNNCQIMEKYYRQACNILNITYLNGAYNILHDTALFNENQINYDHVFHPSEEGCKSIAMGLIEAINGGYCHINYERKVEIIPETGYTIKGGIGGNATFTPYILEKYIDGQGYLQAADGCQYLKIAGLSVAGSTLAFKIGTITDQHCIFAPDGGYARCTCMAEVDYDNNTISDFVPVQLLIQGADIYILLLNATYGTHTISSIGLFPSPITIQYGLG